MGFGVCVGGLLSGRSVGVSVGTRVLVGTGVSLGGTGVLVGGYVEVGIAVAVESSPFSLVLVFSGPGV